MSPDPLLMRQLAARMLTEAEHLTKYPGAIITKGYLEMSPEERAVARDELKETREKYKVVLATHTVLNLQRWSRQLDAWADIIEESAGS